MSEQPVVIDKIDWKRTFPWVRLFRVFRTAIDLRMLLLGCVGLVALAAGDAVFVRLPFAPSRDKARSVGYRWDEPLHGDALRDLPDSVLQTPWRPLSAAASAALGPIRPVLGPIRTILQADATWSMKTLAWTRLLWALCVWAVIGGAMTRIAAVEQTRETKVSLVAALQFSLENFLSYLTAALLPVAGIGVFWILCLVGGWIGLLPFIGRPILGLVWGLELVFGFMMALILIGAAAGWPLMYATISTEASDGFDGFSRAYSYVFSRPWHYAWYGIVALAYGSIVITFVWIVASLVHLLSATAVASGMGVSGAGGMILGAPEALGGAGILGKLSSEYGNGSMLAGAWLYVVYLLTCAFATSYFWTASTVIYLLLRQVDDATDFNEVYLPDVKEKDDLLPLVGVAASDQPIIERPAGGDFAAGTNVPPELSPPGLRRTDKQPPGETAPVDSPLP